MTSSDFSPNASASTVERSTKQKPMLVTSDSPPSIWEKIHARSVFWPTFLWECLFIRCSPSLKWWTPLDDHVFLGAFPFAWAIRAMHRRCMSAVINMCEEYAGPTKLYEELGIEQLRLPTTDFASPSQAQLERGLEFIDEAIATNRKVYIHCKAGRGRSATMALAWLMKSQNLSAQKAQRLLLELRPQVNKGLFRRKALQDLEASLGIL